MNNNIIPIAFLAGTGGRMVDYLLNSAKNPTWYKNSQDKTKLSKFGNAHAFDRPLGMSDSDKVATEIQIQKLLDRLKFMHRLHYGDTVLPYYVSGHMTCINTVLEHFSKAIIITYNLDDIIDIACVFSTKLYMDDFNKEYTVHGLTDRTNSYTYQLYQHAEFFKPRPDPEPNLLNLSFDELLNDADGTINKLGAFTGYSTDLFNLDLLVEWQGLTHNGINYVKGRCPDLIQYRTDPGKEFDKVIDKQKQQRTL